MSFRSGERGRRKGKRGGKPRDGATSLSEANGSFKTDADIAGSAASGGERQLEKWDANDAVDVGELKVADDGAWDQFEVNKKKFGVEDTYDENLYTTTIDTDHPEYEERARRAAQLAREIEGTVADNVHLAEERGQKVEDTVDEEDKYSGVNRTVQQQEEENRQKDEQEFKDKYDRDSSKPVKKFNFAASAAKATSFRPTQPVFVPVPQPYFDQYGAVMMPQYGYYPPPQAPYRR